jgi:hypothetical protein
MNNKEEKIGFTYTYSSREQAEIKRIREKYTAPTESYDKMACLRRLDASVTNTAQAAALILGVLGALILGFGMSLIMTEFAEIIGLSGNAAMVLGIIVGLVGALLACLAYPVYNTIVKLKRKKLAPEIIRLADELLK